MEKTVSFHSSIKELPIINVPQWIQMVCHGVPTKSMNLLELQLMENGQIVDLVVTLVPFHQFQQKVCYIKSSKNCLLMIFINNHLMYKISTSCANL